MARPQTSSEQLTAISFACANISDVGTVLVASCEQKVVSVCLADNAQAAQAVLADEFPTRPLRALRRSDELTQLLALIHGDITDYPSPIAFVRGTALQQQVWRQMQKIPRGHTQSYRQLAAACGRPSASRAIANACGANPLPIIVPCHRVVRSDGGLGGFSCGLHWKRYLLTQEKNLKRL